MNHCTLVKQDKRHIRAQFEARKYSNWYALCTEVGHLGASFNYSWESFFEAWQWQTSWWRGKWKMMTGYGPLRKLLMIIQVSYPSDVCIIIESSVSKHPLLCIHFLCTAICAGWDLAYYWFVNWDCTFLITQLHVQAIFVMWLSISSRCVRHPGTYAKAKWNGLWRRALMNHCTGILQGAECIAWGLYARTLIQHGIFAEIFHQTALSSLVYWPFPSLTDFLAGNIH